MDIRYSRSILFHINLTLTKAEKDTLVNILRNVNTDAPPEAVHLAKKLQDGLVAPFSVAGDLE